MRWCVCVCVWGLPVREPLITECFWFLGWVQLLLAAEVYFLYSHFLEKKILFVGGEVVSYFVTLPSFCIREDLILFGDFLIKKEK